MKTAVKLLFFIILITGCTQKYQTYHIIDKYNFDKDNPKTPITKKLYPGKKVKRSHCEGQVFFSSNAVTKSTRYLNQMVKGMCPNSNYVLNSRLTETWWTTIIYSRSCMEIEGYCPNPKRN